MKQQGFTLVEMSVVLVIIGLILGGIMMGLRLISYAKAMDVITIVEDLRAATVYFKQRYIYLPGDLPYTANEIINVTAASVGTNGDGNIDGAINAQGQAAANSEVANAPWHLYSAGFIGKIDANDAQRRIKTASGAVHIASAATVNGLVPNFTTENPAVRNAIVFFNLPCNIVTEVDNKIDNGQTEYIAGNSGRAFGTACVNDVVNWYAVAL
jgi:prepilin-type N-terminal cleavage/methylation domain-containing protein